MKLFHGIQVYEILENGNLLNAIYTNTGLSAGKSYTIDVEIARKKLYDKEGVEGLYECRYMETETNTNTTSNKITGTLCSLEISKNNGVYDFTWINQNKKTIWKGIGLMAGTTHIAVSYIEA